MISHTIIEQCDCDNIVFLDTSEYTGSAINTILRVFPPDFTDYRQFLYNPNSITVIKPEHIKFSCLPSGLYHMVQSVKPNSQTEVKSCYLHVCPEKARLSKLAETMEEDSIVDLWFKLEIAQKMASSDVHKALELFTQVKKDIDKLEFQNNVSM